MFNPNADLNELLKFDYDYGKKNVKRSIAARLSAIAFVTTIVTAVLPCVII